MDGVNRTLYIPLYGKAYVSKKGLFLTDKKAEDIWAAQGFSLKGKAASRWLAYYMGIRSAVFDGWVKRKMAEHPNAPVIHLGCGLDSRVLRVGADKGIWYDVDFPAVIEERKRYYPESDGYRMIPGDLREEAWLAEIPATDTAIVLMEGVSMYLTPEALCALTGRIGRRFERVHLLMDCYSEKAAALSRYRNPVNEVGVTCVYGMDDPKLPERENLRFLRELSMTPGEYVNELSGMEKVIFRKLYAGRFAKKLYRLYEYGKGEF